jgi:PAS domain S-box-containing protein
MPTLRSGSVLRSIRGNSQRLSFVDLENVVLDGQSFGRRRDGVVTEVAVVVSDFLPDDNPIVVDSLFRDVVEEIPYTVWTATPDGMTEYVNRHGRSYAGQVDQVGRGQDWISLVHTDDAEAVALARAHVAETNVSYRIDCRIRRFDGEFRWHVLNGIPVIGESGGPVRWIGTAIDIHDATELARELRNEVHSATRTLVTLQTLQSKAPIGFGFVDRDFAG